MFFNFMKVFHRLMAAVMLAAAAVFIVSHFILLHAQKDGFEGRPYRVEAERIAIRLEASDFVTPSDLGEFPHIVGVTELTSENADSFYDCENDYLIKSVDGRLYRVEYVSEWDNFVPFAVLNGCLVCVFAGVFVLLTVVWSGIIRPFETLREMPFELAKGNLTLPLKESKSKYFGRFVWGLDMLREKLEDQKKAMLHAQMERQRMILSMSHDIKTPLGVTELYAKALEKGLYTEEEKRTAVLRAIVQKCEDIKNFVDEIVSASSEDFMEFEVSDSEFYLSQLMEPIERLYADKLTLLQTDFTVGKYADCLLKGDADRAAEVLQNLMENAIKYGDGKSVEITFAEEEDCCLISVVNTGCSLSQSELPHIFESFWRGSNVQCKEGSGLGLYICRKLMRGMDGDIFAEIKDGLISVTAVFRKSH